jgi:hypothetical protein
MALDEPSLYTGMAAITYSELKRYQQIETVLKTKVLNQKADNVCWRDVYLELAALLGVPFDPELLPKAEFLHNCGVFYDSLASGCPYSTPAPPHED